MIQQNIRILYERDFGRHCVWVDQREIYEKFVIFCEGDTEYNYIDAMRLKQGVELALRPVNMHGGGYSSF